MSYVIDLAWPFVALAALASLILLLKEVDAWRREGVAKQFEQLRSRIAQIEGGAGVTAKGFEQLKQEMGKRLERLESDLRTTPPAASRRPDDALNRFR